MCFPTTHDLTGAGLAARLLRIVADAGVDSTNTVGQGYDGATVMSGKNNSVQKHTRDTIPTATYVHCSSHVLNLCLAKAASVPPIRSTVTVTHEVAVFFTDSNKRLYELQQCIERECPKASHTRLKKHTLDRKAGCNSSVQGTLRCGRHVTGEHFGMVG